MEILSRLFLPLRFLPLRMPRRRKNQEEVAGRAFDVVNQVLFDVGVDRFLNGCMLLDRQFRLRFFSAPPALTRDAREALAAVDLRELAEAAALRASMADFVLDGQALARQARLVADGLMRELLARSPELRALPPRRLDGVFTSR